MTTTDTQNVRIAITTSVVVHVLLLLLLAWVMGLETAARRYMARQAHVEEVPKVTLLFPEQVIPTPKLKPKLDTKQYIRTTPDAPQAAKPVKSDFVSDHNTKAASIIAPFPDGDKPMPTAQGGDRPTKELLNREHREGKIADQTTGRPTPPAPTPAPAKPTPLQPREPATVPQLKPKEVAKADAPTLAKLMEDMDKQSGRMDVTKLPLQVKKAESAPASPPAAAPTIPAPAPEAVPSKPIQEGGSPMTRTAKVKGTISNKGEASVDAEATPNGRYTTAVINSVEKTWNEYRLKRGDAVLSGYLRVTFYVNRDGHVEDLKFIEKSGNALMDSFTLDAILHTEIAPIPRDLLPLLDDERFPVGIDFILQ